MMFYRGLSCCSHRSPETLGNTDALHQLIADIQDIRQTKLRRKLQDLPQHAQLDNPFLDMTNVTLMELAPIRAFFAEAMVSLVKLSSEVV